MEEKYENLIWLACILIMLGLSFKVYNTSANADCSKCMVSFTNHATFGDYPDTSGKVRADQLFNEYLNGRCLLTWDKWQGFQLIRELPQS
jgi:hypothetical protein